MGRIIFAAEQAFLLGGYGEEDHRAVGARPANERARLLDQLGDAAAVLDRAAVHGVGVGIRDRVPAVGSGPGLVDDEDSRGAAPRGLLIFVGPAAVIGHRLPAEIAFAALEVGVVDEHDQQLALDVLTFEIVPVAF